MTRTPITVHQVDVFTRTPLTGNSAAVVLHADHLSDATMLGIAREMNLSETAFLFKAQEQPDVVPVRFFTPTRELPVCGHATLAAHYVRARHLGLAEGAVTQTSPGARLDVQWVSRDGATFVTMRQGPAACRAAWPDPVPRQLLSALRIDEGDLAVGTAVKVISTGHAKVMVPIRSARVLESIVPDVGALAALSEATGIGGYFLFALEDNARDTLTVCRMFGPALGVPEDPVNGSGHGPLAVYLTAQGGELAAVARAGFWSRMGEHLHRPGRVWVRASPDGRTVDVGGYVTPVFSAPLNLAGLEAAQ